MNMIMNMIKKVSVAGGLSLTPFVALAAQSSPVLDVVESVGDIINAATPVAAGLALLFFFWGLASFILGAGDEEKRKKGRDVMIWGIIALFVIVSIWGLIGVIQQTLNIEPESQIEVPTIRN